jgi:hypothetical protein
MPEERKSQMRMVLVTKLKHDFMLPVTVIFYFRDNCGPCCSQGNPKLCCTKLSYIHYYYVVGKCELSQRQKKRDSESLKGEFKGDLWYSGGEGSLEDMI